LGDGGRGVPSKPMDKTELKTTFHNCFANATKILEFSLNASIEADDEAKAEKPKYI